MRLGTLLLTAVGWLHLYGCGPEKNAQNEPQVELSDSSESEKTSNIVKSPDSIKYSSDEHSYYYENSTEIIRCIAKKSDKCNYPSLREEASFLMISGGDSMQQLSRGAKNLNTVAEALSDYNSFEYVEHQNMPMPVSFGEPFTANILLFSDDRSKRLSAMFHYDGGNLTTVTFSPLHFREGKLR